jgi:hypothetical protein
MIYFFTDRHDNHCKAKDNDTLEGINVNGILYAIIIPRTYTNEGMHFSAPPDYSQQLAYMQRPAGHPAENIVKVNYQIFIRNKVDQTIEELR